MQRPDAYDAAMYRTGWHREQGQVWRQTPSWYAAVAKAMADEPDFPLYRYSAARLRISCRLPMIKSSWRGHADNPIDFQES